MKAEDYITEWCDNYYKGGKELGDWTTKVVMKFANDFGQKLTDLNNIKVNSDNQPKRNVGVIALNRDDFSSWMIQYVKIKPRIRTGNRFQFNDIIYYRIASVSDICSITFDDIIETDMAKQNKSYKQITEAIKENLRRK